jgi:hypothetical protein
MAMVVTAMVMSALATFTLAMCSAWQSAGQVQTLTMIGNQVVLRIQNEIKNARLLGACSAGSSNGSASGAAIMIWKSDTNGDGLIQGSEVEMIYHDTANNQLMLYSGTSADTATWSYSTVFTNSTVINTFKTGRTPTLFAPRIYGAMFQTTDASSTTLKPNLQFALKLLTNDSSPGTPQLYVQYGTATIRSPIAIPNN